VKTALQAEGVEEMKFGFDMQGAQVVAGDPFIDGNERSGSWTLLPTESVGV
jgi:hypothetical protein